MEARKLMRKITLLAALLLLAPVVTQAESLEELLVKKGVITKSEARAAHHGGGGVHWNNGTRLEFPDQGFSAKINTQLQTRYTYTDADDDVPGSADTSSFNIRRARIQVSGNALDNEFSYKVQADFVGSSDTDAGGNTVSTPDLRDAYLTWHACDWADIQMGQFKTRNSRQNYGSSAYLQFPDRSGASNFFAHDRQQGLRVGMSNEEGNMTLGAAIYNGESTGEGRNRAGLDTDHLFVVDARYNYGDIDPYVEGDVDRTEGTAASLGASYWFSNATMTGVGGTEENGVSADLTVKSNGMSLAGEFFWANFQDDADTIDTDAVGFYVQGGYMATDELELAARWSYLDCDNGAASAMGSGCSAGTDQVNEITAGLNYYWWKHNLKGQFAYVYNNDDAVAGSDVTTNKWMFQLSSYF
ncbi:MAG: hypothetical protein D6719_09605 [Candidatus Dadabacteria bacterium]|nr:MAG: hypothetical protein D6719_09605 [Candidatus Dadabacteria bacterium]